MKHAVTLSPSMTEEINCFSHPGWVIIISELTLAALRLMTLNFVSGHNTSNLKTKDENLMNVCTFNHII